MPTAKIGGEERFYCADCYWKLEKEYKGKKNCEECSYFSNEKCRKKGKSLEAVTVGYNAYFVQAEKCADFSTDKDVALAEIKRSEAQGQFEEAALGYEKLGMTDEAGRFSQYKILDPSFRNWFGLAMAMRDQAISDFPMCNKSFNLSYCGHDL